MSIDTVALVKAAVSDARREVNSKYPAKTVMAFLWGRASAADFMESSIETLAALNEIRYLNMDYAHRHGLYK